MAPPDEWFLTSWSQADCASVVSQHIPKPAVHLFDTHLDRPRSRILHAKNVCVRHIDHFAPTPQKTVPSTFVIAGHEFDFAVKPMFDAIVFQVGNEFFGETFFGAEQAEAASQY